MGSIANRACLFHLATGIQETPGRGIQKKIQVNPLPKSHLCLRDNFQPKTQKTQLYRKPLKKTQIPRVAIEGRFLHTGTSHLIGNSNTKWKSMEKGKFRLSRQIGTWHLGLGINQEFRLFIFGLNGTRLCTFLPLVPPLVPDHALEGSVTPECHVAQVFPRVVFIQRGRDPINVQEISTNPDTDSGLMFGLRFQTQIRHPTLWFHEKMSSTSVLQPDIATLKCPNLSLTGTYVTKILGWSMFEGVGVRSHVLLLYLPTDLRHTIKASWSNWNPLRICGCPQGLRNNGWQRSVGLYTKPPRCKAPRCLGETDTYWDVICCSY